MNPFPLLSHAFRLQGWELMPTETRSATMTDQTLHPRPGRCTLLQIKSSLSLSSEKKWTVDVHEYINLLLRAFMTSSASSLHQLFSVNYNRAVRDAVNHNRSADDTCSRAVTKYKPDSPIFFIYRAPPNIHSKTIHTFICYHIMPQIDKIERDERWAMY